MMKRALMLSTLFLFGVTASAQQVSPNGVKTLSPPGAIKPTGTWNLGTRAGDFVYVVECRFPTGARSSDGTVILCRQPAPA